MKPDRQLSFKKREIDVSENKITLTVIKSFLIGLFMFGSMLFLMGHKSGNLNFGRYQISSWGTTFGDLSGGCGAFIIDTATGETKTAYMYIYGTSEGASIMRDNLGKTFFEIK
jgi:hypothetical protein